MLTDSWSMRNMFSGSSASGLLSSWWSRLLLSCVLTVTGCQASASMTSTDSPVSEAAPSPVAPTFDDLMNISVIRAKDLAPLSSKPPEPPPPFDPDAVTASITASFEAFRLGNNHAWWDYADRCEVYSEDVVAKMVNLRAYLTDRGLPPYNLQIEILNIIETAPGFAEATQPAASPSPTATRRNQVVRKRSVARQPASANAVDSQPNKKKIILWSSMGGLPRSWWLVF